MVRPRILTIGAFLLAGAIVTVMTAWVCASYGILPRVRTADYEPGSVSEPWAIDGVFPEHSVRRSWTARGLGKAWSEQMAQGKLRYIDRRPDGWCGTSPGHPVYEEFTLRIEQAGYPLYALRAVSIDEPPRGDLDRHRSGSRLAWTRIGAPRCPAWVPSSLRWSQDLPLQPLPLGFAINTAFYAALLWLLTLGPRTARRWRRRRRGLCVRCAYPIGASPVCSECGGPVLPHGSSGSSGTSPASGGIPAPGGA